MLKLFSSGTKYQKVARQNNCNLVQANGYWHLYQDGTLVAREQHPWNAIQYLTK